MKMIARISTFLPCTEQQFWQKWSDFESFKYIVSPIFNFSPVERGALEGGLQADRTYSFKLYFLKFIPVGRHTIRLVKIDKETNTIYSEEGGTLAPVWNHNSATRDQTHNHNQ